ncbi:MAG: RagB/SusD family nutrient uptake outer membrane protein, partial [Bacteroidales bacterium]|nr:RagB/SusD family nutrient uptake outer membrane protein [Bacteroidales bacterium]
MKKYLFILLIAVGLVFTSCEDYLDRTSLTTMNDENFWTSENNVRLFANGFYSNYFVGYNSSWGTDYASRRGYIFSDDLTTSGKQSSFEAQAPSSRFANTESASWLESYAGPTWNFAWVRKANLFIDRVEGMKDNSLDPEAYQHWSAVARFFRGFEYSRLVSVFGDVPYFDKEVKTSELDLMYKDRDDRTLVMDKVYDDFVYVLDNMKLADIDAQFLNRYIAAGFISRMMLFEGTWQKYHLNNNEKAQKYLELAEKASALIMNSGKYSCSMDFRTLFGSENLAGHPEVLMYRQYDAALGVTHHIASYCNLAESQNPAANLTLAKAFLCYDGQTYSRTAVANGGNLDIANMIATRDSRFEATFWNAPRVESSTLLYCVKFIDRDGPTYNGSAYPSMYGSNTNTNDAPVMRYAEVLLNWI